MCRPPKHLMDKFGGLCFHCGHTGHWQVENPNPRPPSPGSLWTAHLGTPDCCAQPLASSHYQREHVLQVKFVEHDAADWVLIDTGASIHLSGLLRFATTLQDIPPFVFFANSNSSVIISQTTTLKIPVKRGYVIICNVAFLTKSLGQLFRASMVPFFNDMFLSLLVSTTFVNDCWWMYVVTGGETKVSVAVPSPRLFLEMNLISFPNSTTMSSHEWHACDKVVILFLKQHVLGFDLKWWKTFYCYTCAKSKSTHWLARAHTDILEERTLDLLVLDIMGPFMNNTQGF
ncbi:hypothetical protein O181_002627 [Austropuccinia psidii MF-1]|uniref:Uncharacterized protein n=1 Tax=Austropuccinia psidii MF-1 TaxID=1389203 RepID=A0A9Q3GE51_9BASI|nr:hypothetical protein [Austropuccinia psidii MF-1]